VPIYLGLHLTGPGKTDFYAWAGSLTATSAWTRVAGTVTIPDGYTTAELYVLIDFAAGSANDKNRWYYTDVEWRAASLVQPAMAAISTEQTARASADGALSTRIDSVNASLGTTNANVQIETTARVAGDSANASQITQVQANLNNVNASIQQSMSVTNSNVGGLQAQYTVKIDNNGLITGFGLASYPTSQGIVGEFSVHAQRFSVWIPGYPGIQPFTIGVVNGVPRVVISNALIGDASIGTAMIGDAQITSAKVGYAAINTAHIGQAQIDTLRIGPNAVSTMTAWGALSQSVTYQSSGGVMLVILSGQMGAYASQALGGYAISSGATVSIAGASVSIKATGGPTNCCSTMVIQPGAGTFTVSLSLQNAGSVNLAIFEAKR
jgi:hypothetical protein